MNWLYVNPFTGYVHIKNLKIYEQKSDSVFFSANSVSANFEMYKMLHKTYEIGEITLDEPVGYIIQNKKNLNFDDIIERFSSKGKPKSTKPPVHFNILNIKINNGVFYYVEKSMAINYFIKNVDIESSGKWWNADTLDLKFSFNIASRRP